MYWDWNHQYNRLIVVAESLSHVRPSVTPWTVTRQAPLPMGFLSQEYWSGLPFPPPEDIPNPESKPKSPVALALQADSLPAEPSGSPCNRLFPSKEFYGWKGPSKYPSSIPLFKWCEISELSWWSSHRFVMLKLEPCFPTIFLLFFFPQWAVAELA